MTLIKSVLTTIPVYCFLSWILSCMLDKIAKLSMRLFWPGSFKNKRNVWISWKTISIPILMGGWDIKNLIPFSEAFLVKRIWRLLRGSGFWSELVEQKCVSPMSLIDWIRNPFKSMCNVLVTWKTIALTFSFDCGWTYLEDRRRDQCMLRGGSVGGK